CGRTTRAAAPRSSTRSTRTWTTKETLSRRHAPCSSTPTRCGNAWSGSSAWPGSTWSGPTGSRSRSRRKWSSSGGSGAPTDRKEVGMAAARQSVEEVRKLVDKAGIEFLFAQFVEMYGKPNAKLVPAAHLEDVFAEGAGFAGFATGELGQGPHDPDIAAMPDPA